MTSEEAEKLVDYYRACWPQSLEWPEEVWDFWEEMFKAHGRSFVVRAFRRLGSDPQFRSFPPGVEAFHAVIRDLEFRYLDERRVAYEERTRAEVDHDDEAVQQSQEQIDKLTARLAR